MNTRSGKPKEADAEIRDLRARLKVLKDEAAHNEQIYRRTQDREIELLRADSLPELLRQATRGLGSSYGLDAVTLVLEDPNHEVRHLLIGSGDRPEDFPGVQFVDTLAGLAPHVGSLHRPWLGAYVRPDHELLFAGRRDLKSIALIPLKRHNRSIGLLNFGSTDPERFTYRLATDFLSHLGTIVAVCLENACNRARVLRSGLADYLTGWHNRRYLHARLREELARAQRLGTSVACLMIDVDHFKDINDSFGHLGGDEALREITGRIESQIRASDTAARFGGDELALLLPDTTIVAGSILAGRIRESMQPLFEVAPAVLRRLTLSMGLAAVSPARTATDLKALADGLLAEADAALYRAKSAGRDCLVAATESGAPTAAARA